MSSEDLDPATIFHVPKQKPPPDPVPAERRFLISSYPPVGQVTQTVTSEVLFHAVLEFDHSRASKPWQVAVWHTRGDEAGHPWTQTLLAPTAGGSEPHTLQTLDALSYSDRTHRRLNTSRMLLQLKPCRKAEPS